MPDPADSPSIQFHYIKSNHFRAIHVDGGVGAALPNGNIQLNLYSERIPIPQSTFQKLEPIENTKNKARLGEELTERRKGKSGIIRETEIGLIMDQSTAQRIRDWLDRNLKDAHE